MATKLKWSDEIRADLLSIINETDACGKINWTTVEEKFKQMHPYLDISTNALKKQHQWLKTKGISLSDLRNKTKENYLWSDKKTSDLLSIVNSNNDNMNWTIIANCFKQLYPEFKGTNDAIKKQYHRVMKKTLTSTELPDINENVFLWSDKTNEDLISIANSNIKANRINWIKVADQFKELYPLFSGTNHALKMQYLNINERNGLKTKNSQKDFDDSISPFNWTKNTCMSLIKMVNEINVDGMPNWNKICHTFKKYYPSYKGDKAQLKFDYEQICNDDDNCVSVENQEDGHNWDLSMDQLLAQAIGRAKNIREAQIRDGRKKLCDNLTKMTVKLFKECYKSKKRVEFIGNDAIILKKIYDYKELEIPGTYVCDEDVDSVSNIDRKKLIACASKNHTTVYNKIFTVCCHNCGFLFSRPKTNLNQKMLQNAINNFPEVARMKSNVKYNYYKDEKYITCIECFRKPNWKDDYSVAIEDSNPYSIPIELRNLNDYEQNQIALCGGFYTLYKKQNIQCKIFEHRQGECNIGKKRDEDYQNMFTTYFNVDRPHKFESSNEKIKTALRWLKVNNRLFQTFLSNYETIYGYLMRCHHFRSEERIIQISKGNLVDVVGKDTMGLLIPADNVKIESTLTAELHKFGVQHPLQDDLVSLRNIINVNYSDQNLEAKRWPHLFPIGNGSWKKNSSLKQQTYVKHRLLNVDSRFRKNNEFMFFWYDRLIKERLLYYNNRSRTVNVTNLIDSLQVKDIKENENRYGSVVPTSITGSRTYWRSRNSDLLAIVRDLGKPDLFVTLTQNDNWLELQESCGFISEQDLEILKQPIMQPAIGGKSVVEFPVETVVAFYKRLDMFIKSCVRNKTGPFGEVLDYWYRIEYQNRGALHCHMLLWATEETVPKNVVMAEMPRYSGNVEDTKKETFIAREYVKTFQMHNCVIGACKKDAKTRCKYRFPFKIQSSDELDESKMGFTYMRRSEEDKCVVPYNLYALMCWNGHINVQKTTANGIEAYLCKYISKPERSIEIKDLTSDADKFIKARVVGILECCSHLLQYNQVRSTRLTLFLPCNFKPSHRMLKRKSHLPEDVDSEDVYYHTLLYKYLIRPKELENFTYIDMFRFYDVVYGKQRESNLKTIESESQEESDFEFQYKCDETQHDFSCRVNNIKSQLARYYWRGYTYIERGKKAIPRWRFLMPFGNESEQYYEQLLLINVPISETDLNENGYPYSEDNKSETFIEECCLRGLIDSEQTAKSALIGAVQRGFSVERVLEIAAMFVDQSYVSKDYVDSIIIPWVESMPSVDETKEGSQDEYGEELEKMLEKRVRYEPYVKLHESMTESQKQVMQWVDEKMKKEDQILAILSGGAGVGKSYVTRALYSYFVDKEMVCVLLATTGSAAHLISGSTVHYYLKVDIHGNKYLQAGTFSSKIVEDTDVIIVDEFSMLNSDLFDQLNECTKEFGKCQRLPFGGKHVFLIGDPCQLPAIGKSVFSNPLLNVFSVLLLKETVRQKDEKFSGLLNRVRKNNMTIEDINLLKTRYIHVSSIECDDETLIVTATRNKMHFYNKKFIQEMTGESITIFAQDFEQDTNKEVSPAVKEKIRMYVKQLWDEQLTVKEGCIVRLLRNIDVPSGWVNSKRARVFRVAKDGSYIVLQDINDTTKQLPLTKLRQPFKLGSNSYYRLQYPLILGYATTVHSVQGTTVTGKYYVDLDRSFWESGQAFVALSRPKELSQLYLLNTHFEKVLLKPYYQELLQWMIDVDEISIFPKPRYNGDFPLIATDESNNIHIFPNALDEEKKVVKKLLSLSLQENYPNLKT